MPGGFGIVDPVALPVLERVIREEKLVRDHPQQQRGRNRGRTPQHDTAAQEDAGDLEPEPSTHVDLRI